MSLISIFSKKNKDKLLSVFEDFKTKISKTKEFSEFIKKFQIENSLIIVDKKTKQSDHHVVGIITERDIVKTISHHQLDIEKKPVEEIMSKSVVSASPEDSTDYAIKLMVENQIRHLAILDKDRLVGVISMRDIFYNLNFLN